MGVHRQGLPGVWGRLGVIALALTLLAAACNQPRVQLTVRNPTAYPVDVELTGTDLEGRLRLGLVPAGSEKVFLEVLDAGEEWSFRFVRLDIRRAALDGPDEAGRFRPDR